MDRNDIALSCLTGMIRSGLTGDKEKKVSAAFNYADEFMRESILREQTRGTEELHMTVSVPKLREILSIQGIGIDEIDVIVQDLDGRL